MQIIGCDFHPSYQQIAWLDMETGELREASWEQDRGEAHRFYASLQGPVRVGMEAVGNAQWFERLLSELGHELWIGDAARRAPATYSLVHHTSSRCEKASCRRTGNASSSQNHSPMRRAAPCAGLPSAPAPSTVRIVRASSSAFTQ